MLRAVDTRHCRTCQVEPAHFPDEPDQWRFPPQIARQIGIDLKEAVYYHIRRVVRRCHWPNFTRQPEVESCT